KDLGSARDDLALVSDATPAFGTAGDVLVHARAFNRIQRVVEIGVNEANVNVLHACVLPVRRALRQAGAAPGRVSCRSRPRQGRSAPRFPGSSIPHPRAAALLDRAPTTARAPAAR